MEITLRSTAPKYDYLDPITAEADSLILEILEVMNQYQTDGNLDSVQSHFDGLSKDDIEEIRFVYNVKDNPSLRPVIHFFTLGQAGPAQPLDIPAPHRKSPSATPELLALAPRPNLWAAFAEFNFEDLLRETVPETSLKNIFCSFGKAAVGGALAFSDISAAVKQEDPIDMTFDLLRFVIKTLIEHAPSTLKETPEFKFIKENYKDIFDVMQELAHLAKAAKNGSFEGYEIVQLFTEGIKSSQFASKSLGAKIADVSATCTLVKPVRIAAWKIMNYNANELTSLMRITWPLFKLVQLPQTIETQARTYIQKEDLNPRIKKTLTKVADLATSALDSCIPPSSLKFRAFCEKMIQLKILVADADSECQDALKTFGPLIQLFNTLVNDTVKFSIAFKEAHTTPEGFDITTAIANLLSGRAYRGVGIYQINMHLIALLAEGMQFAFAEPSLGPAQAIAKLTKKVGVCSAQLAVAKKVNPLVVALLAPFLMGKFAGTITTLAPPLEPIIPFSIIEHPVSYAYSCANGLMEGNPMDCLVLSSDAKAMATVPSGKMVPYALQHIVTQYQHPEAYKNLSFPEALRRAGHTKQTSGVPTVREDSTLHETGFVDAIRNPIAATVNTATGYYPEWIPGTSTIIQVAMVIAALHTIYNAPAINYDGSTIKMLADGARVVRELRKNPSCTKKALKRINSVAQRFTPTNLKRKFCSR